MLSGGGINDKTIKVWSLTSCDSLYTFETDSQVCGLGFCGHSNQFVSTHGFPNNEIVIWNFSNREKMARLGGHQSRVLHLAVQPDGENIATAAGDETLRLWSVFPRVDEFRDEKPKKSSLDGLKVNFR